MPNHARATGAVIGTRYRFILWLVPTVERFPRNRTILLGDRIQSTAMSVLERLIVATTRRVHVRTDRKPRNSCPLL